jgi:Zn-dependent protease with chaperone function
MNNPSKVPLVGISSRAWEHPADRATMSALKQIPGLDALIAQVFGATIDRYVRMQFLSSAVRVSPRQHSRVHGLLNQVQTILDVKEPYEAYISYDPRANAGAYGYLHPTLVFHSGLLDLLDDDELAFVIAHEVGHAESGHALYHTLLRLLIDAFQLISGIGITDVARIALILALLEWSRKSELSADRAGLLGCQDPLAAWRGFMKLAGGNKIGDMNLDEFLQQALDYDKGGNTADEVSKLLILSFQTHPMPVIRLKELKTWHDSGDYQAVLGGTYPRRSSDKQNNGPEFGQSNHHNQGSPNIFNDLSDAMRHYSQEFSMSSFAETMGKGAKEAADTLNRIFGGGAKPQG